MSERASADTRSITLVVGAMAAAVTFLGTGNVFTLWDTIVGLTLLCILMAARPFATSRSLRAGAASLLSLCSTDTVGVIVDLLLGSTSHSTVRGPFVLRDGIFFGLWFVLAVLIYFLLPWLDLLGKPPDKPLADLLPVVDEGKR